MGATKRMSNGEPKPIGPHPSTIRVSALYMTQAAIEKRLQPQTNDVQERSQAEAREDTVRLQGVMWLDQVRRALQLPIRTFTTASVYYHRFRLMHPAIECSWADAAAASLLMSCKNEDTLKKSRDIVAAATNLKQPPGHEQVGSDDPILDMPSKSVIGLERMVLESGGFDFRTRAPHETLVKIGKTLPQTDEIREVTSIAWTILTDLHRTFAPLKQTSATMALACLELSAQFRAAASQDDTSRTRDDLHAINVSKWHTTREEIMETLLDLLDLYTHHTTSTILGTRYSLDDFLRIRLALNKECSESNLPRHTTVQPPLSGESAQGSDATLRVSNGHPTPVSPPQAGGQAPQTSSNTITMLTHPPLEGGGTIRFMLNPQMASDEKTQVNRYYIEEWEEYEEAIEVQLPRQARSRERGRERPREGSERGISRDHDDRRSDRGGGVRSTTDRDRERRELERLREREREVEREHARLKQRERERDRRYEERRYEDRDRDRRYDDRRERGRDREPDRRYNEHRYEDDRRRDRR